MKRISLFLSALGSVLAVSAATPAVPEGALPETAAPDAVVADLAAPDAVVAVSAAEFPTSAEFPAVTELPAAEALPAAVGLPAAPEGEAAHGKRHFLPTRRRIDREIDKLKFAYKGEVMMGLTASYGTLSSDDTDIMLIIDNIDASGSVTTIKPYIGYFYRDNYCLGVRFGYQRYGGTIDNVDVDLGASNDIDDFSIPYLDLQSDNYSFGIFHRTYAGLDPKGRFGLFAEFELSVSTGTSDFAYERSGEIRRVSSDNTQLRLSFNPGAAVYIFPSVCATISFGLGGLKFTSVTQKDGNGEKIGTRKASNMKFKLNIAAINIGMTVHLWDKKKK